MCHTMGQIFYKHTLILEAAEMDGLVPGHAMCSLMQMKHGALAKGMIPASCKDCSPASFAIVALRIHWLPTVVAT